MNTDIQERGLVECPACQTRFAIPMDQLIGVSQPKFHCSHCDNLFTVGTHQIQPLQIISNNSVPTRKDRLASAARSASSKMEDYSNDMSNLRNDPSQDSSIDASLDEFLVSTSNEADLNHIDDSATSAQFTLGSTETTPARPFGKAAPWNRASSTGAWHSGHGHTNSGNTNSGSRDPRQIEAFSEETYTIDGTNALKNPQYNSAAYTEISNSIGNSRVTFSNEPNNSLSFPSDESASAENPLDQNWGSSSTSNSTGTPSNFTLGSHSNWPDTMPLSPSRGSRWTLGNFSNFMESAGKKADALANSMQKTANNFFAKKDSTQKLMGELFDRAAERRASAQEGHVQRNGAEQSMNSEAGTQEWFTTEPRYRTAQVRSRVASDAPVNRVSSSWENDNSFSQSFLGGAGTRNATRSTWKDLLIFSSPIVVFLLVLGLFGEYLASHPNKAEQLTLAVGLPDTVSVAPPNLALEDLQLKPITLENGTKVYLVTGKLSNRTLDTFSLIKIEGRLFSGTGEVLESVVVPANDSFKDTRIGSLTPGLISELQSRTPTKRMLFEPGGVMSISLVLMDALAEPATLYSVRIYAVERDK